MKYSPRPHQWDAIQDVIAGFESHDRGQLVMACGTGKTLTALWIAEALKVRLTVVFLPSISLLQQYAMSWRENSSIARGKTLCVCSDMSLSRSSTDELGVDILRDSGFAVTTDAPEVERFIRGKGNRVVFCTYQSAAVIAAAQACPEVPAFDLAICDEAHRCAGDISSPFAVVLDGKRIRSQRRLFATATPKALDTKRGTKTDAVDMDNEIVFGPRFHTLPFRKAIDLGLLCDYQVVVVLSDSEELRTICIDDDDRQRDWSRVHEAGLVGVVKALDKFKLRKVITFHHSLKNASRFQQDLSAVAQALRSAGESCAEVAPSFIAGTMSAAQRRDILANFASGGSDRHHVLTNARCLTEGIDVPSVDGIVFVDPRTSEVDIAQALGRALRRSPGKTVGTVVLPILLGKGESPEEVVEKTDFRSVWRVLRALRAHDEAFAASLTLSRATTLSGRGSGGIDPLSKVSFFGAANVREISDVLRPVVVDDLSDKWEAGYELARQRAERFGSCNAMLDETWPPEDPSGFRLGAWLRMQRDGKTGRLPWLTTERIRRLEAIGMIWELNDARWHAVCDAVIAHMKSHGTPVIPPKAMFELNGTTTDLNDWAVKQRRRHKSGKLPSDKVEKLSRAGFCWDPMNEKFERGFVAATAYFQEHGDCNASAAVVMTDGFKLGAWITTQRLNKVQGALSPERIARLEALGIQWNMFSSRWDSAFCILQAWSKQYGHVNVPARAVWQPGTEQELNLGMWLSSQRKLHAKNLLSAERTSLLESVGVQWDGAVIRHDGNWSDALQRLTAYINASNGQRPPLEYVCEDGMQLGRWLAKQRGYWRTGSLKSERAASLAALGIGPDQSHSASLNTGLKSERRRGVRPSVQSTAMHEGSRQRSPNPRHLSLTPGPMVWLSAPHNQYVCALASHFFDARPDVWVGKRNRARLLRKDLT